MVFELFALGGMFFFLCSLIIALVIIGAFYNEKYGSALFVFAAFGAVCLLFGDVTFSQSLDWLKDNWFQIILWGGIYLMLCGVWGLIFRWIINNRKRLSKFKEFRDSWLHTMNREAGPVPDELKKEFKKHCLSTSQWSDKPAYSNDPGENVKIEYNIRDHKLKTTMECIFAPLDIMSYFFGEFLVDIWGHIIDQIGGWMNQLAYNTVKSGYKDVDFTEDGEDMEDKDI